MKANLFKAEWAALESDDLRVLIENRIGGPGQISGEPGDKRFYLPLAGSSCVLSLEFEGNNLSVIEQGPSFDPAAWSDLSDTVDALLATAPDKIGRAIVFSGFRVTGWWRGVSSGVQILPKPADAPQPSVEMAEHPFVLEFPIHSDSEFQVTNARRLREQRKLALLLNLLLRGRIKSERRLAEHAWAVVGVRTGTLACEWVQLSYLATCGEIFADTLSESDAPKIEVVEAEAYYNARGGYDGSPLRVPSDLDASICRYRTLPKNRREKFDRALFWLDVAAHQWTTSMSSSFASLVSAIESLTERGEVHRVYCAKCNQDRDHDVPGPTALFRNFLETYAPGASLKKQRDEIYDLRSGISHGSKLISFDEGRAVGWDPPWARQLDLHEVLWSVTRIALRNYLRRDPPAGSFDSRASLPSAAESAAPASGRDIL